MISELLGAWALDACDDAEMASVERHLLDCDECAAQARRLRAAASWLSVDRVQPAPASLRQATLARAQAIRPPVVLATLVEAYAGQVTTLSRLLDSMSIEDWQRAEPRHGDVAGVVAHLARNDGMLVDDLGLSAPAAPAGTVGGQGGWARRAGGRGDQWRDQARFLVRALSIESDLDRSVRMAGPGEPMRRPLRDALVQRAFETWIHVDDVASVVGRPGYTPPPEQVRRIADLAVRLLPAALRAHGVPLADRTGAIVLTGPAGGEWTVTATAEPAAGSTVAFIATVDAVEFARLVANRRSPETLDYEVSGDAALAARVLQVAATLGCD